MKTDEIEECADGADSWGGNVEQWYCTTAWNKDTFANVPAYSDRRWDERTRTVPVSGLHSAWAGSLYSKFKASRPEDSIVSAKDGRYEFDMTLLSNAFQPVPTNWVVYYTERSE
jgi:hypothetical protein